MKLDPAKRDASLPSVEGLDEKAAEKALGSAKGSAKGAKRESVEDVKARLADATDEELEALAADERKGVQEALAAERERRAAAAKE